MNTFISRKIANIINGKMYRYVKNVNLLVHFEAGRKTSDRRTLSVPFTTLPDSIGLSLNIELHIYHKRHSKYIYKLC